jgi:nicotinamidase-related amidase
MNIEKDRTAVVVMDYQQDILDGYAPDPAGLMHRAGALLEAARRAGLPVIFVRVVFRPGYPEVSGRNITFCGVRESAMLLADKPGSQIPAQLVDTDSDVIVEKHRVGAFEGTVLATVLRSKNVDTLLLFGVATSGCVLSTVRHASDLDYRLTIVEDLCADLDQDLHDILIRKIFPGQTTIVQSEQVIAAL